MKMSKCRSAVVSEVKGQQILKKRTETEKGRSGEIRFSFLLLFTVSCFLFAVSLTACGKKEEPVKEETKISVVEKKAEVAPSAEAISAEAYKGALVVSDVTGVNWQKGVISATGRGLPPKHITNPAQAKILVMRAAIVEAQKNLLEIILKMKTPPDKGMKEYLDEKHIEITRIEGFVKGAIVVKEEYKDDGSAEATLEVQLVAADGLVAVLK